MKGRPKNPCSDSYKRVETSDCCLNAVGEYIYLCSCEKYLVVRRVHEGDGKTSGTLPRHNGRAA